MMNKTTNGRSALLALLLLCLSIFVLAVPKAADASGIGNARVIDEMNLLSDAEVQKLDAQLAAVERTHRIRILAAIVGDWKDKPLKPSPRISSRPSRPAVKTARFCSSSR